MYYYSIFFEQNKKTIDKWNYDLYQDALDDFEAVKEDLTGLSDVVDNISLKSKEGKIYKEYEIPDLELE